MSIKSVLRMGDPRLLEVSREVVKFGTPELEALVRDMRDTMAALDGAGLAAPQIGVSLQVVIFGVKRGSALYRPRESGYYTVDPGNGIRMGGLPQCSRDAGHGAALR
jgi:peptide deformylase